ncbi:hypothetical protein [Streptomyces sp. NPDC090025]|uniref:hypothetical protein n=1 Tax=Streptomyces sp. NPDC090025 TaxID=3365922 RepID=UPI0038395B8E
MEILTCAACAHPLTAPLHLIAEAPDRPGYDGTKGPDGKRRPPATLPRGCYAIDPEPSGAPMVPYEGDDDSYPGAYPGGPAQLGEDGDWLVAGGPRNSYVTHPDDVVELDFHPDFARLGGCCGPAGDLGVNRVCPGCGAEAATVFGDCVGPYETHFAPDAVRAVPAADVPQADLPDPDRTAPAAGPGTG